MTKTILITGSTDGIGKLTATKLAAAGHHVLVHGRSQTKVEAAAKDIGAPVDMFVADLSDMSAIKTMAENIKEKYDTLDVLINNAGVLKTQNPILDNGHDIRFVVNTFAPYLLTQSLMPILKSDSRVVNLSSAAQARIDLNAMKGGAQLGDMDAYAQSKLAITIWTREMAKSLSQGPAIIAVNPGSMLASKMVKEGFGVDGNDLSVGADILIEAALGDRFADATGAYFDNDSGAFANPHAAAMDEGHAANVMDVITSFVSQNS
jgi:NAD(P)-dependent dehydrogenase (short-subunit alcohol dehydrogenase family)